LVCLPDARKRVKLKPHVLCHFQRKPSALIRETKVVGFM